MGQKKRSVYAGRGDWAPLAATVNLQAVSIHLEAVLSGLLRQHFIDVTAKEVLGEAAAGAN